MRGYGLFGKARTVTHALVVRARGKPTGRVGAVRGGFFSEPPQRRMLGPTRFIAVRKS